MDIEALIVSLTDLGASFGLNLIAAIAILVIGRWVARLIHRLVIRGLERSQVEPTLVRFVGNLVYTVLLIIVVLAAVSQLGVETTSVIALLGAAGLAVGLALQGSLANFAAGVLIMIFRPYRVGDYVEGGGTAGTIEEVQIFTTVLKTPDNRRVIVPNGQMMSGIITNYSANPTRRVDLVASVSYDDDIDHVQRVLVDVVTSDERVLAEPAPVVRMLSHGDSSIEWAVRPWVDSADYWPVFFDLTERIKRRFDEEGISIPFPQRDVHLYHHVSGQDVAHDGHAIAAPDANRL